MSVNVLNGYSIGAKAEVTTVSAEKQLILSAAGRNGSLITELNMKLNDLESRLYDVLRPQPPSEAGSANACGESPLHEILLCQDQHISNLICRVQQIINRVTI